MDVFQFPVQTAFPQKVLLLLFQDRRPGQTDILHSMISVRTPRCQLTASVGTPTGMQGRHLWSCLCACSLLLGYFLVSNYLIISRDWSSMIRGGFHTSCCPLVSMICLVLLGWKCQGGPKKQCFQATTGSLFVVADIWNQSHKLFSLEHLNGPVSLQLWCLPLANRLRLEVLKVINEVTILK